MLPSILNQDIFTAYTKEHKIPSFRIKQVYQEIFNNQQVDFAEMTTLPKDLRETLAADFSLLPFTVDSVIEDKKTTKIGFKTEDGHIIEIVILYHRQHDKYIINDTPKLNRITLCISSQIGCPMNCLFCVTGKMGIIRNLTREEMVSQVLYANNYIKKRFGKKEDGTLHSVRNVVFMGMGEPLLNYDNVKKSVELMLSQQGLSLSRRHITISTCGIIPGIYKLIEDNIPVKLAISLHAPNQTLRNQLMPIAKTYPLDELMHAIDDYVAATDNRIFYEYIMIKDKTDSPDLAYELADLLRGKLAHVNLIPYNENPAIALEETSEKQIWKFKEILEKRGVTVTVRDSLGRDAKGACGQLGYEKIQGMIDEEEEENE